MDGVSNGDGAKRRVVPSSSIHDRAKGAGENGGGGDPAELPLEGLTGSSFGTEQRRGLFGGEWDFASSFDCADKLGFCDGLA